ncbi:hypothetical protein [Psychroflexus sp. MES1-P1E]|uniref:hypothetical protein n=1 Tax=Psychroflexus sp. MES1-P1E TaxID=2058320 RepID=UPI000C797C2B|nr:hypothetical protein [Psychroflexus sp. MES1-P1E]PKG44160.1 hypothetical protein CXF67_01005 [Psychroflexus sp. MES1-P1E]
MTSTEVEIDKSIKLSRLVYKESFLLQLIEIPRCIICAGFIPYFFLIDSINNIILNKIETFLGPTIFLTLSVLVIYSYFQTNKLTGQANLLENDNKKIIG